MFFFTSPFRSRQTTSDWRHACWLLENTLRSILNQTDGEFRVLIACHEIPDIEGADDVRVSFHQVAYEVPTTLDGMRQDKQHKRRFLAKLVREAGGGYLMHVDADDLVSRHLVAHVRRSREKNGYIINNGIEFDLHTKKTFHCSYFDQTCGTCAIINFTPDDLPRDVDGDESCRYFRFGGHHLWRAAAEYEGRPLAELGFPGAMYVLNHGQNLSKHYAKYGRRQRLARWILGRSPDRWAIEDFALRPYLERTKLAA